MINTDQYDYFVFCLLTSEADPLVLSRVCSDLQIIDPKRFRLAVYHNLSEIPRYAVEFNAPHILEWLEKNFPGSLLETLKVDSTRAFILATIAAVIGTAGAALPTSIQYILSLPDCSAYLDAMFKEKTKEPHRLSRGPSFFASSDHSKEGAPALEEDKDEVEEHDRSTTPGKD